ncbi:hypothetical protein GCM10011415_28620 [Salipiger pallidus]|uniref:Uncharacterized protein n=1 Tax=Salipiger pallidus TaxID=1775170 RepID=A0A8J2ZL44_9RHOB|nr:hypothetical protein [Salipiger pallidus]GGG77954.1 hypothetical protein GCM10011415_28620 [Salipiger pallidus]
MTTDRTVGTRRCERDDLMQMLIGAGIPLEGGIEALLDRIETGRDAEQFGRGRAR